jgi:hypothetical protein
MLAGLALGTRLSAGVPISEASWQLAPRDLNGVYVYAPKDFVGIMNTAIDLLSANQRLIESRAARLEWIAKSNSSIILSASRATRRRRTTGINERAN